MYRKIIFNGQFVKTATFCTYRIRMNDQSNAIIILHRMQVDFQKIPFLSPLNFKRLYIIFIVGSL